MLRKWTLNLLTTVAALGIVGMAIAFAPVTNVPESRLAETRQATAHPPPGWTDPADIAVGRIVLTDPAAQTFRFTADTKVYTQDEYLFDEQNSTVVTLDPKGVPTEYAAMLEVVRGETRELHVFDGLGGLWAWIGNESGIDTSQRPGPFRVHLTPEVIRYHVWAKDCPSRVPTDPPEIVNRGFITYGASRGMTQHVEFIGDNETCGGYRISISSLGSYRLS